LLTPTHLGRPTPFRSTIQKSKRWVGEISLPFEKK
jgi:hypothetical protein